MPVSFEADVKGKFPRLIIPFNHSEIFEANSRSFVFKFLAILDAVYEEQ